MWVKISKHVHWTVPAFLLGFLVAWLIWVQPASENKKSFSEVHNKGETNYKFINPLLECDTNYVNTDAKIIRLRTRISDIVNQQKNSKKATFISVYYRDLNNGPWIGINERELFNPASLMKVPILIAYYKYAESDPTILSKQILNLYTYTDAQQYPPQTKLELNKSYTVDYLLNKMITDSDNIAYALLMDNADPNFLDNVYRDLGINIDSKFATAGNDIVSVKAYAGLFRVLYNASYLSKASSEKTLELLSRTNFNKGLVAGLPGGTAVAHKFGERANADTNELQLHDCGIIYSSQSPYLLCVMTRGVSYSDLEETIKLVSQKTYEALTQ
jgi:beta-lactamase class A